MTTVATGVGAHATRAFPARSSDHAFFSTMAIVASIAIAGGFGSTYGTKMVNGTPPFSPIVHLHAAVFACWLVVFITQTTLVRVGRTDLHRRLGVASVVLAAAMVIVSTMTSIASGRAGHTGVPGVEFADAAGFLMLNLAITVVFGVLYAAGWYCRRSPQTHKRLMLMATTGALVGPGVSRLPFASGRTPVIGILVLAFMCAGPAYDLITRRRLHPAYAFALPLALLGIPPVVARWSATPLIQGLAAWLLR